MMPERKKLPHHPNIERHNQPVILFLTLCVKNRHPVLANDPFHCLLKAAWAAADSWLVGRYMVMPDHVHLFCSPAQWNAPNVKNWAEYWKGLISRALKGYGPLADSWKAPVNFPALPQPLWQTDCWDTQLKSVQQYSEKWEYVSENPVRKQFVNIREEWIYQGCLNELRW